MKRDDLHLLKNKDIIYLYVQNGKEVVYANLESSYIRICSGNC